MVVIGILLAALCNFALGILGYTIAFKSTFLVNTFQFFFKASSYSSPDLDFE
jgi:hypothetical protein